MIPLWFVYALLGMNIVLIGVNFRNVRMSQHTLNGLEALIRQAKLAGYRQGYEDGKRVSR